MGSRAAGPVRARARSWLAAAVGLVCCAWLGAACRGAGDRPSERPGTPRAGATSRSSDSGPAPPLEASPGASPLHLAALAGDRATVESLLGSGANANVSDDLGARPLHYAARAGHRAVAELLITEGAVVHLATDAGVTALHEAARHGRRDVAELLLAAGAPVNARDFEGNTPLGLARESGHEEVASLLAAALPPATASVVYTLTLTDDRPDQFLWLADDVVPQAYHEGEWWLAIANRHSVAEGQTSPCSYRRPWSGAATDGGLWLEHWRLARGVAASVERVPIAAQTLSAAECTPQEEIDRRFAAAVRSLPGRLRSDAIWSLARADSFHWSGVPPQRLRYRILRTPIDPGGGETLVCFSADAPPGERCLRIYTHEGGASVDSVTATAAAVHRDTLWVFGLRTSGELVQPQWVDQPIGVVPIFLGRIPLRAAPPGGVTP